MFWAITCEDGKQYSQVPTEPFRISMAALEPRDKIPTNKQVSLMVESKGKEFLLCTLEYDRVMQVNLDLRFNSGEKYAFFVNGEGTIHLSGHLIANEVAPYEGFVHKPLEEASLSDNVSEDDEASEEEEEDDDISGTQRLLALDDSADEDSEEWKPEVSELEEAFGSSYLYGYRPETRSRSGKRVNFAMPSEIDDNYVLPQVDVVNDYIDEEENEKNGSVDNEVQDSSESDDGEFNPDENEENDESSDEDNAVDDDDEEEEKMVKAMRESQKRKKSALVNSNTKRPKTSEVVIEYHGLSSETKKSKKKSKKKLKDAFVAEENLDETAMEMANVDDMLNSSIGRTPMPKKKGSALKSKPNSNSIPTPVSLGKNFADKSRKASFKHPSGVEYEDLKVGAGPTAKSGKMVHIHYIGRLENGEVFDKILPSKKPLSFRLGEGAVFKGMDIGLEGMKAGGKRRIKIPPHMGYGKKGHGLVPANSTMIFNIELKAVS